MGGMLDFLNLNANIINCGLCEGVVDGENCSTNGCEHVFHVNCMETWTSCTENEDGYTCPLSACSAKFTEIIYRKQPRGSTTKVTSMKKTEDCPICCEPIQPPIATPESCNHTFCFTCLREWSRVRHECPLDRGAFELMLVFDHLGGPVSRRVQAPPVRAPPPDDPPETMELNCEVCQSPNDEAHLLLCDHCDRGFHTYCLPVPLSSIPIDDWFCPDCVQHGIGSELAPSPIRTRNNGWSRRLRTRGVSRVLNRRATMSESETNVLPSSASEDESGELFNLSNATQHRLVARALQRHRGTDLLRSTISRLAERVLAEASIRAQRRQNQRHRVRNQLATEAASRSRQLTLTAFPTTRQPSRRPSSDATARSRSGRSTDNVVHRATSGQRTRSATHRRRLLVLSDSSANESESEQGITLHRRRLTRPNPRAHAPPTPVSTDSDEEYNPNSESFNTNASVSSPPSKRLRTRTTIMNTLETTQEGDTTMEADTTNTSNVLWPSSTHSINTSAVQGVRNSTSSNSHDDSITDQPIPSTSTRTTSSTRTRKGWKVKKTRKPKSSSLRKRRKTSKVRRPSTKLTKTQRKIKRKVRTTSKSSSASSGTSSQKRSTNRPLGQKVGSVYPRLSILGAESNWGIFAPEEEAAEQTSSATQSSTSEFRPTPISILSEIEAGQTSMFKFSTRNMCVNPDNSMSPIPVVKKSSLHPQPSTSGTTVQTSNVSRSLFTGRDPLSTRVNNNQDNGSAHQHNSKQANNNSSSTDPSAPENNHDTASPLSLGWTNSRLDYVRSVIVANLKPRLVTKKIDQGTYQDVLDRCVVKVQRREFGKVTDARIAKLVNDYITYFSRRDPSHST